MSENQQGQFSGVNEQTKKGFLGTLFSMGVFLTGLALVIVANNLFSSTTDPSTDTSVSSGQIIERRTARTPDIDEPVEVDSGFGGLFMKLDEVKLIDSPYIPSGDLYASKKIYDEKAFRLALKGEFEVASIYIKGKINNNLNNFLSINVGTVSGVYGLERSSMGMLNIADASSDVIYTKGEFEAVIDLKDFTKLSTTKTEFLKGKGKAKDVYLWGVIQPEPSIDDATITRLYATMYDEYGNYGNNVEITEYKFIYACGGESVECEAYKCESDQIPGSNCLVEKFDNGSAENYIKYMKAWEKNN